mmetsp:Transcript_28221/g.81335  ORF Transcript_28221/g.81335 Transcript_28221/m.81335 type:complete len:137 (-) Transcript_28221:191-601(-)
MVHILFICLALPPCLSGVGGWLGEESEYSVPSHQTDTQTSYSHHAISPGWKDLFVSVSVCAGVGLWVHTRVAIVLSRLHGLAPLPRQLRHCERDTLTLHTYIHLIGRGERASCWLAGWCSAVLSVVLWVYRRAAGR